MIFYNTREKRKDLIEKLIFSFNDCSTFDIEYLKTVCIDNELYEALIYICNIKNEFLIPIK